MTTTSRTSGAPQASRRLGLSLALLAGVMSLALLQAPLLWGQDDFDADEKAVRREAAEEEMRIGAVIQATDFYQWVYGQSYPAQFEQKVESQFALQLDTVQRVCTLSDSQKKKLELAGRGDAKRFYRTVDALKEKCVGRSHQALNEIWQEIQPLRTKADAGLFGEASLFRKTLRQTLSPEQSAQYEKQERERRRFRYEAKIENALSMMETSLALRAEQRQRFVKLLLDETEPPKQFSQQGTECYVLFYQAGKLGEEKLKTIFDEAQWRTLQPRFEQARQLETYLKSSGFVP